MTTAPTPEEVDRIRKAFSRKCECCGQILDQDYYAREFAHLAPYIKEEYQKRLKEKEEQRKKLKEFVRFSKQTSTNLKRELKHGKSADFEKIEHWLKEHKKKSDELFGGGWENPSPS